MTEPGVADMASLEEQLREGAQEHLLASTHSESRPCPDKRRAKRRLRILPVAEKLNAIQRVLGGESKVSVARNIGVPESTLRGWCKSEHKIRSMARNSSTPVSDAHSPASSSGGTFSSTDLSSDDEDMAAGEVKAKKLKLDIGLSVEQQARVFNTNRQSAMDCVRLNNSLTNSVVWSGGSSMLLQQLELSNFGKALNCLSSPRLNSSPQTLGLVENGLQYTKSGSKGSHITAIAPTTQFDQLIKSRKSLPPAAEAPSTPLPASPRNSVEPLDLSSSSRSLKTDSSNNINRGKFGESLRMWAAQQQLLGQQQAHFNSTKGSWFWQLYKSCCYPQPTPLTAQKTQATLLSARSPTKAKALLDSVLSKNISSSDNNEQRCSNEEPSAGEEPQQEPDQEQTPQLLFEQAMDHGEKFLEWLERCSDPSVTQFQIIQFKNLIHSLKAYREKT